jgi:glycosyltransferase involved in cell wall biosynthesis
MKGLSIVIPYYKGSRFVFDCIDSLLASYELSPQKIPFEIIVVVDSPDEYTEKNVAIASHYDSPDFLRIILNNRNSGVAFSRNKGLAASRYDYITFIDQDDRVMSGYFTLLPDFLNDDDSCVILNGYWHTPDNGYEKLYYIKPDLTFDAVIRKNFCLWTPGLMVLNKKKIQIETFFFNVSDKYAGCDDWFAVLNMILKYPKLKFRYIKTPLFIINRHDANFSNDSDQMLSGQIEGLKYFRNRAGQRKHGLIDRLIKIRRFQRIRTAKSLSKTEILRKYSALYAQYLFNKWGYFRYPLYKMRKTLDKIRNHLL